MKTITIHNIDDYLVSVIDHRAKNENASRNKVIKRLLAQALGMQPKPAGVHRKVFSQFCGVWSKQECREFTENISDLEQVNMDDWK